MSNTTQRNGRHKAKINHASILDLPLSTLAPAVENDQLYRPVDPDDPDVKALAVSIRQHGLREPIVITTDRVILSGHRRRVACLLAGVKTVPCRVEPISRFDPEFLPLLREYNRQRVKSLDEVVREEIISANPEEAYRLLREHRQKADAIYADTIEIEGYKHRARITKAKHPFLEAIRKILEEREDYWPLTDRQIHYALLNDPPLIHASKPGSRYTNTKRAYNSLTELVTRARLTGEIPFEAIHDPTRPTQAWNFHRQPAPFVRREFDLFLKGYYRDLMQSQPNHVEIIGEKNTIESIVRPVAMEHGIPYSIGRGYCSLPPRKEMEARYHRSGKSRLILLVLSDFDPEGEDIGHSFARSMRDDFGINAIVPIKVALTAEQVADLGLPPQMKAKKKSSRRAKFVKRHGDNVFELEALHPEQLQEFLTDAIDSVLDIDAYNAEVEAEKQDAAYLEGVRRRVQELLREGGIDGGELP